MISPPILTTNNFHLKPPSRASSIFKFLVDEKFVSNSCDVGLICSTSKQLIVGGNPLRRIGYDQLNQFNKTLKCYNSVKSARLNCAERFAGFASDCLSIFDLEKDTVIREFHDHNGNVADLTWHRTCPYILASVGRDDATLRLWDVRAHPAQVSLRRAPRSFRRLQYSPDCSFVACAGESITIYDMNQAQTFVNITCNSQITNICFNPAECLIASASEDRLVRFWDVDTGECVTQSLPFESHIQQIEFEPSGKYLIVITSTQLAAISWEPFELLAQVSHSNSTASTVLDVHIEHEKLLFLSSTRENLSTFQTSSLEDKPSLPINSINNFQLRLISLALSQLEKCNSLLKSPNEFAINSGVDISLPEEAISHKVFLQQQYYLLPSDSSSPIEKKPIKPTHLELNVNTTNQQQKQQLRSLQRTSISEETVPSTPSHSQHSFEENWSADKRYSLTDSNTIDSPLSEEDSNNTNEMVYSLSSPLTKLSAAANRGSMTNVSATPERNTFVVKCSPATTPNKTPSLKQSRSKSCSTKSLHSTTNTPNSTQTTTVFSTSTMERTPKTKMHQRRTINNNQTNREGGDTEEEKLDSINAQRLKMREHMKRRKDEIRNSLGNINLICKNSTNIAEAIIDEVGKHEEPHTLAQLLRVYLANPKSYSLALNARFLDRIRTLFSYHKNQEYLSLGLELLEMVCTSFGDSIRHGLSAKNHAIGVDVAADERFEKCTRCRNALMQIRLNSAFLSDHLSEAQVQTFQNILLQIDRITSNSSDS